MDSVQPWMRLKVKSDTFFLPDEDGAVYFRNNAGSFRMEGASVLSWIEKLLPALNGQHTLANLTDGLPGPYRDRIYEVAGILYENGFIRDISTDDEHQLSDEILQHYAPQIEFVDNLIGSGAFHFETYRNANILAVGSGSMLASLVGALLESGLARVNMVNTDAQAINNQGFGDLFAPSDDGDAHAVVRDLSLRVAGADSWRDVLQGMDAVVYVSKTGDIDALRQIESACNQAHTLFLPANCVNRVGIVGPIAAPSSTLNTTSAWEAAWRRIHSSVFQNDLHMSGFTDTAGAMLANVLVFELFKAMTGVDSVSSSNRFYTLNVETLEGKWHDFIPALFRTGMGEARQVEHLNERLATDLATNSMSDLLSGFAQWTDTTSGIFHVWNEGDLIQLPLAQCRVQSVDPLSHGPAALLAETVCAGLTHEDARREAGLTGIEHYVRRLVEDVANTEPIVGIGAGATIAEAVGRGLHFYLMSELNQALQCCPAEIRLVQLSEIHDEACAYYLEAMRALAIEPVVGLGQEIWGLPTVWVGVNGRFVGSVGFCVSMALQRAFAYSLQSETKADGTVLDDRFIVEGPVNVVRDKVPVDIEIEPWHGFTGSNVTSAMEVMARNGKNPAVLDLALEPFLTDVLAGVIGVSIRQGESQ